MSYTYTVFCKMPDDGRNEYSEEIDVESPTRNLAAVRRLAVKEITERYDPRLRPSLIIRRVGTF
jgi:hypothetical protein